MAAVADLCAGEITKIGAKIRAKNPFLLISRKRDAAQEVEESKESKQQQPSSSSSPASPKSPATARREESMSETTVFLLMDRFAPS
ncbi:hypothetical protein C2S53_010160 [Perilla frutescens var. hirtella]|uniref:Uncharacterized protein n=1 Tax=Perilla frutescens var. hirtella TaxID=608512 RepID=A0AAD4NYX2_PERFH|nr:hypothetical protein C2S53_010160 [Perilla frutescens var. hirtella]